MSIVSVERPEVIARGAYADILALGGGRVFKAFRRKSHTATPVIDWADHDAMTKAEFRAEARSYEKLAAFPELKLFAPRYFGRADPLALLSEVAEAPSMYVAGCGIVLEQIPGAASKLEHLEPSLQLRVETLLERFHDEVGICYVWDSSCFVPGTRAEFTVIDFGTWDGFGDYQIELNETGRLSQTLRARLERENAD